MKNRTIGLLILMLTAMLLFFAGCSKLSSNQRVTVQLTETASPTLTASATATPSATATVTASPTATATATATATPTPVILAAVGDIAICGQEGDDQTAALIADWDANIIIPGDPNNEDGTLWQYQNCYEPAWGVLRDRIHTVAGNHDYYSDPNTNYYAYFGEAAGPSGLGYYSFDLGDWHIIALNSNCGYLACGPSSDQVAWLKEDLASHDNTCSLTFWHHPYFSSGLAGNADWLWPFWDELYAAGVDVIINGHDHHYERFAKLNPAAEPDPEDGIREFIVGTGGASLRGLDQIKPGSEVRIVGEYGVLKLILGADGYQWEFFNVDGEVLDSGIDTCGGS